MKTKDPFGLVRLPNAIYEEKCLYATFIEKLQKLYPRMNEYVIRTSMLVARNYILDNRG